MAEERTLAIEVESPDGEKFSFSDRVEAIEYASQERAKWNWLAQLNSGSEYGGVLSSLPHIIEALNLAIAQANGVSPAASDETITRALRTYVGWTPAIHNRAPLQAYLMRIAQRSNREAMWALGWLAYRAGKVNNLEANLNAYWNAPGFLTGMNSAWVWAERTLTADIAESELERVRDVASEAQTLRDQSQSALNTAQSTTAAINGFAESGRATMSSVNERLDEFEASLSARLEEIVTARGSELQERWSNLTTTYEESLKLKAPARYWGVKQAAHRKLASRFAWASGIFATLGGIAMSFGFFRLMENVAAGSALPPWRDILPSAVLAIVFLWTLRTLLRMTMSHVHLSLDAGERRVMVECYLAMTNKGETTGEERGALFAAIFRSSGDGIVKDETPPIPMWEMLKATKGKD